MKRTGLKIRIAICAALAMSAAIPSQAQVLKEGQPGSFDLLMFDPHVTPDWSAMRGLMDRAYGSQYQEFGDRKSYVAARSGIRDQAILMVGEDRTLMTAVGLGVPEYLKEGLFAFYPKMTAEHLMDFDDGLTFVAIDYDDGQTFVSVALMREYGSAVSKGAGPAADLGGPKMELTETLAIGLPPDSTVISTQKHGPENGPQTIIATAQVPMPLDDASALIEKSLKDQGYSPTLSNVGGRGIISIMTRDIRATFTVSPVGTGAESIISTITNINK